MTPSTTRETAPPATEQANSNETDTRPPAVEVCGLGKTFGETRAVDGIDLTVPRGGIFGLLGPNGAGKTTAIRMLATLLAPDAGTARVLGYDVSEDPAKSGVESA
ncbi:ATP-binding cassette domain-containing protein [Halovivax gelatinilyticus]|uniref:ATP-binding cassette domain-containing protein n=1 Tax=Halovivax gelatinilyticus TaxID=2961597 RepID=UPI0020CA9593|nr:ATP-binding cassette domain-containing protein [Halovivax gelatinilyticus]